MIYEQISGKRGDAMFEAWDALLLQGTISSFPMSSSSAVFQRKWHRLYKTLEEGEFDTLWLASYLGGQVPREGTCHFSLGSGASAALERSAWQARCRCSFRCHTRQSSTLPEPPGSIFRLVKLRPVAGEVHLRLVKEYLKWCHKIKAFPTFGTENTCTYWANSIVIHNPTARCRILLKEV